MLFDCICLERSPYSTALLGGVRQHAHKTALWARGCNIRCVSLQAVAVESNENGQLTDRLAVHAQQAPILDAWLNKFPTLRQGLPAHQTLPEVATAVHAVAKRILASKAAAATIKVAFAPTSFSSCSLFFMHEERHVSLTALSWHTLPVLTHLGLDYCCTILECGCICVVLELLCERRCMHVVKGVAA